MKKILSFVRLDFYTLLPYLAYIIGFMVIGFVFGLWAKSFSVLITFFLVGMLRMTGFTFSICEKNKLETLYSVLPISRKITVAGRYLFNVVFLFVFSTMELGILLVMNGVFSLGYRNLEIIALACILFALVIVMISVQFPLYFALGYNKAGLIGFLPVFALIVLINLTLLQNEKYDFIMKQANDVLLSFLFILASLVLSGLSCVLSFKLYERKDT
jgi:hypothetical protein